MSRLLAIFSIIAFVSVIYLYSNMIIEPFYRTLKNTGNSTFCKNRMIEPFYDANGCNNCAYVKYGPTFDYKALKSDRTYGVPNGCQKIF